MRASRRLKRVGSGRWKLHQRPATGISNISISSCSARSRALPEIVGPSAFRAKSSGVDPNALDRRIAISVEMPLLLFTRSDSA